MRILSVLTAACLMWGAPAFAGQALDEPRLTLRAALVQALQDSPQLQISQDVVETAEIRQHVAASRFGPKVSPSMATGTSPAGTSQQTLGLSLSQTLSTGATLQGSTSLVRYGSSFSDQRDAGFSVGVSQPLLRGFGAVTRAELDSAKRGTDRAVRGTIDARQQLVVRVAQAYFSVVREQRLEAETTLALGRAGKLAEMSEARSRVGLATRLDVYRAGLLQSQAQAAALRARDALAAAREDLNILMGRPAESPFVADPDFAGDIEALAPANPANPANLANPVNPVNFDVFEANARLVEARRNASIARWNLLPNVLLDVNYTQRGLGQPSGANVFGLLNGWTVGLRTAYSFDTAADSASAATAAIAVRAAERDVADAEQRVAIDAGRAARAVSRTRDTIGIQRTALGLAGQQLDLATLRYERGLADNLEIIDAETHVFQTQSALIAAEIDHALAQLTLQRVSGTLDPDRLFR